MDLSAVPAATGNKRLASEDLGAALERLRAVVGSATYPGELASAGPAREGARTLAGQLDDYLMPRLRRFDAPLLAVVGGSTGAGKSTLVNSLVRSPVSAAGVIRPTTRGPVLVCHPADGAWFGERSLLSGLARSSRPGDSQLQVVSAPLLRPGLALLDAPDIDSVVAANRELARELLAAGDLWLFVTTAARYADAVPWGVLRGARDRGTAVAVVLDRVPPEARDEIAADFARMLAEQDLGSAPLFVVLESTLDGHGMLGELIVAQIKTWLDTVASSSGQRRAVTRGTLLGAVAAAGARAEALAVAAEDQTRAAATVAAIAREAYGQAMSDVEAHLRSGTVLRGGAYARWQEAIASGELGAVMRAGDRPRRGRAESGDAIPAAGLQAAVAGALAALVVEANLAAAQEIGSQWRFEPVGRELLTGDPSLGRPWPGFADAAHDLVHGWLTWLRTQAKSEAETGPEGDRGAVAGGLALFATIAAVVAPAHEITGSGAAAEMLRAVVATPAASALGDLARGEFLFRVGALLAAELDRRLAAIGALGIDPGLAARLREAAAQIAAVQVGATEVRKAA